MTGVTPGCDAVDPATRPKLYSKIWGKGKSFLLMFLADGTELGCGEDLGRRNYDFGVRGVRKHRLGWKVVLRKELT